MFCNKIRISATGHVAQLCATAELEIEKILAGFQRRIPHSPNESRALGSAFESDPMNLRGAASLQFFVNKPLEPHQLRL